MKTRYTVRLNLRDNPEVHIETSPGLDYADIKPWAGSWFQSDRATAARWLRLMRANVGTNTIDGTIIRRRIADTAVQQ